MIQGYKENTMVKIIKLHESESVPVNFTGIIEWLNRDNIIIERHYIKGDKLHREDGPAIEWSNGTKEWWFGGVLHREDGPAIEQKDGTKQWFKNGKRHREDGPAVEWSSGKKSWHLEDKHYYKIYLKDFVVLDYYKGKYDLIWYKILDKDEVFEHPDIPGLITK